MESQSGKTCYSIVVAYSEVEFSTWNSSSAGFGISNNRRGGKPETYSNLSVSLWNPLEWIQSDGMI
jgi:hypothetical protein